MIRFNSSLSYGTPSYYVQRMFSNNIGQQNIRWSEQDNVPAFNATKGSIGLGTWATSATFTDLSVTASDTTFSVKNLVANEWTTRNGSWELNDGTFRQTNTSAVDVTCVLNKQFTTTNVDMTVHATKNGGSEGFLIIFDYKDAQNYSWLNLGGWTNTQHAIEQISNGGKLLTDSKRGRSTRIEKGRWYDVTLQVAGDSVKAWLDNELIFDTVLKHDNTKGIFSSATIDDANGELIVKVVNTSDAATTAQLNLKNFTPQCARVVRLAANDGMEENALDAPTTIHPVEQLLSPENGSVLLDVPPYSLNIIRIKDAH